MSESVFLTRDREVLQYALEHVVPVGPIIDLTAGNRVMWRGVDTDRVVTYVDVDPDKNPDLVADYLATGIGDSSFSGAVWDPPHLPNAAGSPMSSTKMIGAYGLGKMVRNLRDEFRPLLREVCRILKPDGVLLTKLKDYVHNHRYQWVHVDFVNAVEATDGMTPCDLYVKRDPRGGALNSSRWVNRHHVRNVHCYWIVVRKGGCERRRGAAC